MRAVEQLIPGPEVDQLVGRVLLQIVLVDVYVDPTHSVGEARERVKVDLHVVRHVDAGEVLGRVDGELPAPVRIGVVELARTVAGHLDLKIARQREDREVVVLRVGVHQDHAI